MNRLRTRIPLIMVLLAVLAVPIAAACGDDDDGPASTPTPGVEGVKLGDLTLAGGWVRTTANDVSAGYMAIHNAGLEDTSVSASSPIAPMVQLHEVVTEGSSSKMQEKEGGFVVPAQGMVELKPGGYHIMLMGLTGPLDEGDEVELTLTFEKAGDITLTLPVQKADGSSMDMDGHSEMESGTPASGH